MRNIDRTVHENTMRTRTCITRHALPLSFSTLTHPSNASRWFSHHRKQHSFSRSPIFSVICLNAVCFPVKPVPLPFFSLMMPFRIQKMSSTCTETTIRFFSRQRFLGFAESFQSVNRKWETEGVFQIDDSGWPTCDVQEEDERAEKTFAYRFLGRTTVIL